MPVSVGILSRRRVWDHGSGVLFPAGSNIFFFAITSRPWLEPIPSSGTGTSFPLCKAAETRSWPLSSIEVKKAWSYSSDPPIRLHGAEFNWRQIFRNEEEICLLKNLTLQKSVLVIRFSSKCLSEWMIHYSKFILGFDCIWYKRLETRSDSVMKYWDGFLTVRTLGMMYKLEYRKL